MKKKWSLAVMVIRLMWFTVRSVYLLLNDVALIWNFSYRRIPVSHSPSDSKRIGSIKENDHAQRYFGVSRQRRESHIRKEFASVAQADSVFAHFVPSAYQLRTGCYDSQKMVERAVDR